MKILLLNDTDNWAGTESHIFELAMALHAQGAQVTLACPARSPLARRGVQNGLAVAPLALNRTLDRRVVRTLVRWLRSGRADLIHAHNGRTQLHGALAIALARRGALVWTQHFIAPHHVQSGGRKTEILKRVHRAVNARTAGFIAISHAVRRAMIERNEAPASRIIVVPNGTGDPRARTLPPAAQVRARYGVAPDAPLVVALSRLEREKSVATLLEAWAKIEVPTARLIIAGRGAARNELAAQIETLKLGQTAQLAGFIEDAPALINAADVLAHSAPAEPFGLVFLEAMGLGKPVVACAGGAAPEIVLNGATGLLVAPHDTGAMAGALTELLRDPARAQQLGRAGRARFEAHYTREHMARATRAVYDSVREARAR